MALAPPLLGAALLVTGLFGPGRPGSQARVHVWAEELELRSLLDTSAAALGIALDYDPARVQGKVALRTPGGLDDEELWLAVQGALLERGLTSVQSSAAPTLRIVELEQAARQARIEPGPVRESRAGYVRVLHPVPRQRGEELAEALSAIAGPRGSLAVSWVGADHLLVQGPRPAVLDALEVLALLEAGSRSSVLESYEVQALEPATLAALVEQITQKQKSVGLRPPAGTIVAGVHTGSVFLVAPADEIPRWRELVQRLDRADAAITRTYRPRRFGLAPTAELVRELVRGREGGGAGVRILENELTGALVVTAPAELQLELEETLGRLEETPWTASRTLRSIPVEHRDAEELAELLRDLLASGPGDPRVRRGVDDAQDPSSAPSPGPQGELPWDDLGLSLDRGTNRLIAFGDARLLDELEALVRALDVPHSQVLVEALVVALSESQLRDLGVELRRRGSSGDAVGELASLFALGSLTLDLAAPPSPQGSGLTGVALGPGDFSILLRALETVSEGRAVTLPRVLVSNHATGGLDSVLQTPYLATNASNTVATTSLGGTLDAGTTISVTPHITDGWRLRLEVTLSVSSFVGEPADPSLPPPRQENRLETEVSLPDGHTAVVGGLEVTSRSEGSSQVPWLGRLPLLGGLFRSTSTSEQRTRLFVFLRCNVLRREGFEDLRHLTDQSLTDQSLGEAGLGEDWPRLEPRVIR